MLFRSSSYGHIRDLKKKEFSIDVENGFEPTYEIPATVNHKLLTKFVFSGMQKNKKTLIPYLLAGTMTVMIYYILQSLAHCPYIYKDGVEAFYGAQLISILLEISGQIVAVFATVFLFIQISL